MIFESGHFLVDVQGFDDFISREKSLSLFFISFCSRTGAKPWPRGWKQTRWPTRKNLRTSWKTYKKSVRPLWPNFTRPAPKDRTSRKSIKPGAPDTVLKKKKKQCIIKKKTKNDVRKLFIPKTCFKFSQIVLLCHTYDMCNAFNK